MRIQTRLFLGTALLVLALMAVQWWLHLRQLRAMEAELGAVAASVGKDILQFGPAAFMHEFNRTAGDMVWVNEDDADAEEVVKKLHHDVRVVVIPEDSNAEITHRVTRRVVHEPPDGESTQMSADVHVETTTEIVADRIEVGCDEGELVAGESFGENEERRYELQVVADDEREERFLVIRADGGGQQRIPIPVEPAVRTFRSTMQRGFAVGGALLVFGLVGAGVLANRVTRPLRGLADGAEAVGRGELGVQVPVTAAGEVGELQRSFNTMSARLAELETERERWRQREHLAQLGDLSRGLAHTVRNPLNTLGLAVEELATGSGSRDELVVTARSQIRRIDQWLRSFLALGAEDAAESTSEDLGDLTRAVVFEAVQQGRAVEFGHVEAEVPVTVVATALRAALANLLENASDATSDGASVEVEVGRDGDLGTVTVRDHGPGLPEDVRTRLFEPHVTTKVGGSGMGLFLARQLIVGMHGGVLEVEDHPDGGTIAVVKLPIAPREESHAV
jgi:signal transduction histidine kinase